MTEAENGQVEIKDMTFQEVTDMVNYMYSGVINVKELIPLLKAADRYDIAVLRQTCGTILGSKLTPETVLDVLLAAEIYSAKGLVSKCILYVSENHKKVKSTPNWEETLAHISNKDLSSIMKRID